MENKEQLEMLIDLYKFYLELIVQSGILAGAIVGGILGYLVKQKELIVRARIIPSFLSASFAIIYAVSIWPSIDLARTLLFLGRELNLILIPHAWLLPATVAFFLIVFSITSISIFYWPRLIEKSR